MDENKESSFLRRCPRCNNFLPLDSKECKNCGYSFEDNNKDSETLSFGMTSETSVEIFKNIEYTQAETTRLKKAQIAENILVFIVGICSLLLLFLPLFAKDNFFSQCKELTNYYNFYIEDFLLYDKVPNLASEARIKLKEVQPDNFGQAIRISGVNPSDISILSVYMKRYFNE